MFLGLTDGKVTNIELWIIFRGNNSGPAQRVVQPLFNGTIRHWQVKLGLSIL